MLARVSNCIIRSVVASNLPSVIACRRLFSDLDEPDEANCPKSKEFDDLMEKKNLEKQGKPELKLKGDDYPFELEEEDYVPMIDPKTGEWNPPRGCFIGAEPTRYGDWEIKGRCYDF
ncbi:hypothetical protein JH06_5082 [Blastocystis sp. subtype 4]|uniref:hypothetical protein n=1 Tax=Blastocystis sp. subtype 4 TaxID=944170 RepID=UPI0007117A0C|nr:hypothetical protein JH06_5082 [Blastocystis sp. subtype 4]KNB44451.1 hypothetical protein JH06_5082 [Blastocystis sp. subtype 4]|eukprot:XP_014527903.1 hypothetical protein JH06_5082 [Blastocystis sp. subtype 4]